MKSVSINEKLKVYLDPKKVSIKARLFVTRDDGITVYDTIQDKTTSGVAALVSGVWQASEALMALVKPNLEPMHFRLGYDTSSEGVYLFPLKLGGRKYFLGAIYQDCLNPGALKRQVAMIKQEIELNLPVEEIPVAKSTSRSEFLFSEITDAEIDRLFSVGGN